MTLFSLILAFAGRTPLGLWVVSMICDTAIIVTYLIVKH